MSRLLAFGIAFASIPTALLAQNSATQRAPSAIIKTYCVSCHSGPAPQGGGLPLDQLDADRPSGDVETWERVVRQLRARTMPPMASPRPDRQTYESTIASLTRALIMCKPIASPLTDAELAVRLSKLIWYEPDQPPTTLQPRADCTMPGRLAGAGPADASRASPPPW